MKLPDKSRWCNFKGEMGSNGQFDEIALMMFFEDNPEYQDKPIKDWLEPSNKYIKQLQINYDNKDNDEQYNCDNKRSE